MNSSLNDLEAYLNGYWISDLSNFSAFIFQNMPNLNWAGFYLSDGKILRLGPFCGKPACMEIAFGKGVCGTAFQDAKSLIVDDVDVFPGHIRCDSASRSELVAPFYVGHQLVGVFDLDSPTVARFSELDRILIEKSLQKLGHVIFESKVPFGKLS